MSLIFAILSSEITTYSLNTLYNNGRWISHKSKAVVSVTGSVEFLIFRQALFKNKLNLGKYYGYHSIYSYKTFSPERINFDVSFSKKPFLEFYFKNDDKLKVIRLKRDRVLFLKGELGGKRELVSEVSLKENFKDINRIEVRLGSDQDFFLNGHKVRIPFRVDSGQIGFLCGKFGCKIDNIQVRERNGQTFDEDFKNRQSYFFLFLFYFAISLLFLSLARTRLKEFYLLLGTVNIGLATYYTFDYFYFSQLVHIQNKITKRLSFERDNPNSSFEDLRFFTFQFLGRTFGYPPLNPHIFQTKGYPRRPFSKGPVYANSTGSFYDWEKEVILDFKEKESFKILFLGSSQMLGSGASILPKTSFSRIINSFNEGGIKTEGLNYSLSGEDVKGWFRYYRKFNFNIPPDLVILNIGYNGNADSILRYLPRLLNINDTYGIETLIFLEPNNSERGNEILSNTQAVKSIASSYNITVINSDDYIRKREQKEFSVFWWDDVHLTDYGQQVYAEFMTREIRRFLNKF
ncbi:MAG: SGNH/GDSL hydrolase family protein [Bdellovibrionota bacterium]|nr:SGNH/GDSL hydrolase family protein [Bdellovibrionota bacterium]